MTRTTKPQNENHTACPMDSLLKLLMGPWTTYILWLLRSQGPQRYGELKAGMPGISSKVPVSYTHLTLPTTPYV